MHENAPKLGKIVRGNPRRDAIHVAVIAVEAGQLLPPGAHVGRMPDGAFGQQKDCLGVVDPFLVEDVKKGQHFWLFLYPNTVTSLRHHWAHPGFPDLDDGQSMNPGEAETWLKKLAHEVGQDYESLIEAGREVAVAGFASVYCGESFRGALYDDGKREAYWLAWSAVTGEPIPQAGRDGNTFSCRC